MSTTNPMPGIQDNFIFDCDYLLLFCSSFEKADLEDHTDSLLETKLADLSNTTYENVMLANESSNTKDFKEKGHAKNVERIYTSNSSFKVKSFQYHVISIVFTNILTQ